MKKLSIYVERTLKVYSVLQAAVVVNGYLTTNSGDMCYFSICASSTCGTAYNTAHNYWTVDMKTPKNISRILYQGGSYQRNNGNEIRAGLDPDIFNDPVVATLTYIAVNFYMYSFEFEPPIQARYIGVAYGGTTYLEICKLMAFE